MPRVQLKSGTHVSGRFSLETGARGRPPLRVALFLPALWSTWFQRGTWTRSGTRQGGKCGSCPSVRCGISNPPPSPPNPAPDAGMREKRASPGTGGKTERPGCDSQALRLFRDQVWNLGGVAPCFPAVPLVYSTRTHTHTHTHTRHTHLEVDGEGAGQTLPPPSPPTPHRRHPQAIRLS